MDSEITRFDPDILAKMVSEQTARISNSVTFPTGAQAVFDAGFIGYELPSFAHKTANGALQHELPVAFLDGRYITTRLDYSYSGDQYWWIDGQDVRENLSLLEASVGFLRFPYSRASVLLKRRGDLRFVMFGCVAPWSSESCTLERKMLWDMPQL